MKKIRNLSIKLWIQSLASYERTASSILKKILLCLAVCCTAFISGLVFDVVSHHEVYADCTASISVDGAVELDLAAGHGGVTTDTVTVDTDCLNGYTTQCMFLLATEVGLQNIWQT